MWIKNPQYFCVLWSDDFWFCFHFIFVDQIFSQEKMVVIRSEQRFIYWREDLTASSVCLCEGSVIASLLLSVSSGTPLVLTELDEQS